MRLFDKALGHLDGFRASVDPVIDKLVVLACDPIVTYWVSSIEDKEWNNSLAPYARMPWPVAFYEWNIPNGFATTGRGARVQQIGFVLVEKTPKQIGLAELYRQGAEDDVVVCAQMLGCVAGAVRGSPAVFHAWMSADGQIRATFVSGEVDTNNEGFACAVQHFRICLVSNTFVNCSNVKLEDVTEDLQPEPKIRRRLKLPEVKRYTLNIAGHVARPSRDCNEGQQGVMPFHLCRGHFATYTADKPMFGNPKLVGRYWHPPHMKGKKENGEIVKDYAIAQ